MTTDNTPKDSPKEAKPPKGNKPQPQEPSDEALFHEFMQWRMRFKEDPSVRGNDGGLNEQQLSRIVRAVSEGKTNGNGLLNPEWSDPADTIDPVRFFAPYSYFPIYSKKVGQFTEGLPNGLRVLNFTRNPAKTRISGDGKTRQFMCDLVVTSHSIYKWLTGEDISGKKVGSPHQDFRSKFYMDKDVIPADNFAVWERIYSSHVRSLEAMTHAALLKLAETEHKIQPSSSMDKKQIAVMVAKKRADNEYERSIKALNAAQQASADLARAAFV